MPRILRDYPDKLKSYLSLGMDLSYREGDKEALGDCPWCGREGKFSIDTKTGLWRCLICGEGSEKGGGNATRFLSKLWEVSYENTKMEDYGRLADDRGVEVDTLIRWGWAVSTITREWIIPGYNHNGKLLQLYRYARIKDKRRLLATSSMSHQMFGVNLFDPKKPVVYLCEGPWDAMVLWETLAIAKETENGYSMTSSPSASLLSESNVLAVPGCTTFAEEWATLFKDRWVYILFDNDYPKRHPKTGKEIPPASLTGAKRTVRILSGSATPPEEINYLKWGEDGYDPSLPDSLDVRDWLNP